MEQINQLKTMRDAALARLKSSPDYKLVSSLEELIVELEAMIAPNSDDTSDSSSDAIFESADEDDEASEGNIDESSVEDALASALEEDTLDIDESEEVSDSEKDDEFDDLADSIEKQLDKDLNALGKDPVSIKVSTSRSVN